MQDVITDIPPPWRFFQDDLINNIAPPSPPLPSPFLVFSTPKTRDEPLRPTLLIIAIATPSHYIFHHVSSKSLIGSLILPEIPFSGNSIEPALGDKSCNSYYLHDSKTSVLLISIHCAVAPVRAHLVAKLLISEKIVPERVLILDSVQSQNFRGKLSQDATFSFKLETSSERENKEGTSSMKSVPENGGSAISMVKSLVLTDVLPGLKFKSDTDFDNEFHQVKDYPYDSDMYT